MTLSTEMPDVYRQTTETTGMYSPLKKHLQRAQQIVPSKNCASHKIIPSHAPLTPYDFSKRYINNDVYLTRYDDNVDSAEKLCDSHYDFDPFSRPYTPPEKRYSSNFGLRLPERKFSRQSQTAYVYENVHADDFCANRECNMNRIRGDRYSTPNVKIKKFPDLDLEFNQMYIQENLN